MNDAIQKQHYSIGELAEILGVSTGKIRTLTDDYQVPHTRRGQTRYYTADQAAEVKTVLEADALARVALVKDRLFNLFPSTFKRFAL